VHRGGGLELRRKHCLIAFLALAACGSPTETHEEETREAATSGGEVAPAAMDAPSTAPAAGGVAPVLDHLLAGAQLEPQLITPIVLAPRPSVPARARLGFLTLDPGQTFRPPTGACQDMLLYVRDGEVRAVGTGIAPPQAPATLYPGDAVRFGPEADGLVQNLGERRARSLVAFVRAEGEPSFAEAGPSQGEGCRAADPSDPLVAPLRAASVRSTPAHPAYEGALRVQILLDEDGAGARHGSLSVLEGAPELTMPAHRHEGGGEILVVEEGMGTMRIGEREVAVRPGITLYVPPGVLHDFRGDGTAPLRAIQIHTPAGAEQRMRAGR
jgi:putative monooxygenase